MLSVEIIDLSSSPRTFLQVKKTIWQISEIFAVKMGVKNPLLLNADEDEYGSLAKAKAMDSLKVSITGWLHRPYCIADLVLLMATRKR